ncbi:hypothetical protein [Streptomyces regalis]|uniref:Uncharacterized protein n=1 Tax=Streptomyces regalis TaxID=68262 RepID=A0A0X3V630_9ACTN|nr:hypothetical protein [Streptomyces regalis]KUL40261.1 hypothetical protein ADL12_13465 [Streptomyces regalis]
MRAGCKVETSELDGLVRKLPRNRDEMRPALNALYATGPKPTGSRELDNTYSAMARDFGMSGSPGEMTARV